MPIRKREWIRGGKKKITNLDTSLECLDVGLLSRKDLLGNEHARLVELGALLESLAGGQVLADTFGLVVLGVGVDDVLLLLL